MPLTPILWCRGKADVAAVGRPIAGGTDSPNQLRGRCDNLGVVAVEDIVHRNAMIDPGASNIDLSEIVLGNPLTIIRKRWYKTERKGQYQRG
jgi:hypothetical protein